MIPVAEAIPTETTSVQMLIPNVGDAIAASEVN
jgi:hypothetical protein